jgi:hypothetical protein
MKTKKTILTALSLSIGILTFGQDLPKPSPSGKVQHTVGLNKIGVEYSRPSAKGRVIFGDLVAFDSNWRLGANASTKLTTSEQMMFGKNVLEPGTYAMYAIVSKDMTFTLIFSRDLEKSGADDYEAKDEIFRIKTNATENSFVETFTIDINNITTNSGSIVISWEKMKVEIPFTLDTDKTAQKNIDAAIAEGKDLDKVYYRTASYYFDAKGDIKKATEFVEKSIAIKPMHSNTFLLAQILYKNGDEKKAIIKAEEAKKMALAAESKGWADYIGETIEKWNKK